MKYYKKHVTSDWDITPPWQKQTFCPYHHVNWKIKWRIYPYVVRMHIKLALKHTFQNNVNILIKNTLCDILWFKEFQFRENINDIKFTGTVLSYLGRRIVVQEIIFFHALSTGSQKEGYGKPNCISQWSESRVVQRWNFH